MEAITAAIMAVIMAKETVNKYVPRFWDVAKTE